MPKGEPVKDFYGRVQGYMDEQPNGDIWCYDFYGRLVGKYIKSLNVTRDFYGRNVAKGNVLASFIMDNKGANK